MGIFLETKRLILKEPELSDLDNLVGLRSDPDVMKYTGDDIQDKEEVKECLDFFISYYNKHGLGFLSVFEKKTGDFVGQAGLFHLLFDDTQAEIEIAYRLHKKFWGKGYATELAKALILWGFQNLSKSKLIASSYPENIVSQKVLKKAGLDFREKIKLDDGTELLRYEIYKNDSVELVHYNNQWPKMAELEIENLKKILPSNHIIDIQHIGSTAIPGMLAKPIIDIQIAVDSLAAIKKTAIDILKTCGYVYWDEDPDPEKMFFVKGMPPFGEKRTHHVHIIEPKSKRWKTRIIFRDYLIAHPEIAREYEQLKITLAKEYTYDREQYTDAKTKFIDDVLRNARINCRMKGAIEMNELNFPYEVSSSTQKDCEYISDEIMRFNARQVPFTQEITPIFKRYVIKNKDEIIAGINAVLYHWGMLFVDELFVSEIYRGKKLGTYLMQRVEDEAKELGATLSHTDTFDFQAKDFYLKQGYEIFGELSDCPPGHTRFYLKKYL